MLKRISAVVSIITLIFSTLMLQQGQSKKLYLNQEIKINYIRMIDEKIFVFDFKNLNEDEDLNTIINQKDSPWINPLMKEFYSDCKQEYWVISYKIFFIPTSKGLTIIKIEIINEPEKHENFCYKKKNFFIWLWEEIKSLNKTFWCRIIKNRTFKKWGNVI